VAWGLSTATLKNLHLTQLVIHKHGPSVLPFCLRRIEPDFILHSAIDVANFRDDERGG
jgi:hypothetical protein